MSSRLPVVAHAIRTRLTLALALAWLAPGLALAEVPAGLAPPGPCAEPREAVTGVAPGSGGDSVPPLAALLSPSNVAAPPSAAARSVPSAGPAVRPGPCDQPGAGCALLPGPKIPPITPGGRPSGSATPVINPDPPPVAQKPTRIPVNVPGKRVGNPHVPTHKNPGRAGLRPVPGR